VEWFVVDGKRDIEPYDEKKRYSHTPSRPARLRLDWRGGATSGAVGAGSASGSTESTTGAACELHVISVSTADDKVVRAWQLRVACTQLGLLVSVVQPRPLAAPAAN
jgi:hypothetical protein